MKERSTSICFWDSDPPVDSGTIAEIDYFNARGMKCVYGRGDHFTGWRTLQMDIWRDKHNRLLMRFWSRNKWVVSRSYEITGTDAPKIQVVDGTNVYTDEWIPRVVREAYDDWVEECHSDPY